MAYLSRAERARVQHLDLRAARDEICAADGCSRQEAEKQFRAMLVDGVIRPVHLRWDPDPGDLPPHAKEFWQEAKIDPDTAQVFDDYEQGAWPDIWQRYPRDDGALDPENIPLPRHSKWRTLLLDKAAFEAACEAIWPRQLAEANRGSELVRKARAWLEKTGRINAAVSGKRNYKKLIEEFEKAPGGLKIGERDMRRALTGK